MINNNSYYRGQDILNDSFKNRIINYFNPYEYNFESSMKDNLYNDEVMMKSKSHTERNKSKK